MWRNRRTALAAVVALGVAWPAQATVLIASVTGTIDSGSFQDVDTGAGVSLDGLAYSVVYTVDTTLGIPYSTPTSSSVIGSHGMENYSTIPVTAIVKIAGYNPFYLKVGETAYAIRSTIGGGELDFDAEQYPFSYSGGTPVDGDVTTVVKGDITSGPLVNTPDLAAPLARAIAPGDTITTTFHYAQFQNTETDLDFTSSTGVLSFNILPAVPEPQSWVLLIIGFGFCGAAMRRRGRGAQTAAACRVQRL
jgi:hypothetical protein